MTCIGENVSPTLDMGVEGTDLLFLVAFDRPFTLPLADTGVRNGLLAISLYTGLAVHSLDSTSLL